MEHGQAPKKAATKEPPRSGERWDRHENSSRAAGDAQKKSPGTSQGASSAPDDEELITPEPSRAGSILNPNTARRGREAGMAGRRGLGGGDDVPEAPEDDPALTGPLGLRNDAEADEVFLKGVMEKLAGVEGREGRDEGEGAR